MKKHIIAAIWIDLAATAALSAEQKLAGTSRQPLLGNQAAKGRNAAFPLVTRCGKNYDQAACADRCRYTHWSNGSAELDDE